MQLRDALAATAAFTPEQFTTFGRHIDPEWIEEALLSTGHATLRRRRLPNQRAVWLVIGMALMRDRPMRDVVRQLDLALPAGRSRELAPSSVSLARARLGVEPLEWLFGRTASEWAHASADQARWRGLAIYAADGTTARVPDSDENRSHFGGQKAGAGRGESGYPIVRMTTLIAARSHLVAAVDFGPYGNDERSYAATLWRAIPDHSLTLLDRAYLQANVLVPLRRDGSERHWMTRAKSNTAWRVLAKLGPGDWLIEMDVSDTARRQDPTLPKTFQARAIRYQRKGFQPSTLLTSLTDPERYPANELRGLYHERWEIELAYAEIKTDMLQRNEAIRSKSPEGVAQELFGILLAYNLIRLEMVQIADEIGVSPLRISFVAALRFIVDEWSWATITSSPGAIPSHLADMRDKICRFLLPERRPERSYPRAVKIKMSNYPRKRPSPARSLSK
jgi:hypothetical protein